MRQTKFDIASLKKIHFVGIGGIGMSALAKIFLERGIQVQGSDAKNSKNIESLKELGATIYLQHASKHVDNPDLIVYSGAIAQENPELTAAVEKNIPVLHRADLLGELMRESKAIAITGAHGKTTTCAMLITVLRASGLDPTFLIGGIDNALKTNAHTGKDPLMVVEADESDASFVRLSPHLAVCTNIDREHLDFYPNMAAIERSLRSFLELVPIDGMIFINNDDAELCEATLTLKGKKMHRFSAKQSSDTWAKVQSTGRPSEFELFHQQESLGNVTLAIGGLHNISNALAAAAVAIHMGCEPKKIVQGLNSYQGVQRRCQLKGRQGGITVYDDYAHHPTEIRALLRSLKHETTNELYALFQPHRHSRFQHLYDDFLTSFEIADRLLVLPVYGAHENVRGGKTPRDFVKELSRQGHEHVDYAGSYEEAVTMLLKQVKPDSLVVTLGAGDIYRVGESYLQQLRSKA